MERDNKFDNEKSRDFCNGYVDGGLNTRLQKMALTISIPYRHLQWGIKRDK